MYSIFQSVMPADYEKLYKMPERFSKGVPAICLICKAERQYASDSKGNLLKHYQQKHPRELNEHLVSAANVSAVGQTQIDLTESGITTTAKPFVNQKEVEISIARDLCAKGSLPLTIVEKPFFRQFLNTIQPKFKHITYRTNLKNITNEAVRIKSFTIEEFRKTKRRPNVTVDCWTAQNGKAYLGCNGHFFDSAGKSLNVCLFLAELPPPHTSANIRLKFEEELENYDVEPYRIITDNAANMKSAFSTRIFTTVEEDENTIDVFTVESHFPVPSSTVELEGTWNGCCAHLLQLVVKDGMKEARNYPALIRAIEKAHKISVLSKQSTHFKYDLDFCIPKANVTRWNSELLLLQHLIDNSVSVNSALEDQHSELILRHSELESLKKLCHILTFFKEGTDILQGEQYATFSKIIPTIQQLENALMSHVVCQEATEACIGAIRQRLLNSLRARFGFLKRCPIFVIASALDPSIKLDFTEEDIDIVSGHRNFMFDKTRAYRTCFDFLRHKVPESMSVSVVDTEEIPEKIMRRSEETQ